jgi:hypothetical protein
MQGSDRSSGMALERHNSQQSCASDMSAWAKLFGTGREGGVATRQPGVAVLYTSFSSSMHSLFEISFRSRLTAHVCFVWTFIRSVHCMAAIFSDCTVSS